MIHGDDIYVTTDIGGTQMPVAAAKTGNLSINQDFIKACAPNEGRTFRKIPTSYDWSVSCDCLMANTQYAQMLVNAVRNGSSFTLQFIVGGFKVKGTVFVKNCEIQSTKGNLAKMTASFESSGPLVDDDSWDFINGTMFTYSNYANGTLTVDGTVTNGTLQQNTPSES